LDHGVLRLELRAQRVDGRDKVRMRRRLLFVLAGAPSVRLGHELQRGASVCVHVNVNAQEGCAGALAVPPQSASLGRDLRRRAPEALLDRRQPGALARTGARKLILDAADQCLELHDSLFHGRRRHSGEPRPQAQRFFT